MLSLREQPNQFIPENEKNQTWFTDNVRYVASKYNTQQNNLGYRDGDQVYDKPVDEMLRMFSYYLGKQENRDYYYTTKDQSNCDLPTVWINGQKLTSMIDFMLGSAIKMIENIEPSVRATNKAVVNKKTRKLELALLKLELSGLFNELEKIGIYFNPTGKKEFSTPEETMKYMQYDYKEYGEEVAQRMATDILYRNRFVDKYKQAFFYTMLGGVVGIENKVVNKRQVKDIILPYNLIWDNSIDDDLNTRARFVGKIDWLTPGEILSNPIFLQQLTDEEVNEIKTLNTNNIDKLLGEDNITTNKLKWYYNTNGVPSLAAVTTYWIGYKELRYEQVKDKFGNTHYAKIKGRQTSQYFTKTVYKGTLLANKYLVDFGEQPNIVRKSDDMNEVELPISVFIPNMVMGESRSIASRLHKHQDRIDFLNNEITKMVTRAKGKVFILNKHKLGTATSQEVLNDFERIGIHITDGNATGEDYSTADGNRIVEVVDMTLDPNVNQLLTLKREEERIMEEIVNVPKIAMGQQAGYVGAKTQAGTIAQSNLGTAYLYEGFIRFIEKDLQYALNQYKISLLVNEEEDLPVIGDRGIEYLKLTEDFKFEDFAIYIKVKDFIDDSARERLIFLAQAAMQNQLIDMADFIKIETAKTYTELLNQLEFAMNKKKMEAQQQQQLQMLQQQAMQEQALQAQTQQAQMREEGQNFRAGVKSATDIETSGAASQGEQVAGAQQPTAQ